jgi:hypothetical protein
MSLVGAEVDISIDTESFASHSQFRPIVSDDESSVPENQQSVTADLHPPLTPPREVEKLFLDNLETQNISAAALAQVIHQSYKTSSNWTGTSVNTDDFATALPWNGSDEDNMQSLISARSTDTLTPFADDDSESDSYDNIFQKDVLSRDYSIPETETTFKDSKMATIASYPTTTSPETPKKFVPTEPPKHVDAAEKVYDTVKGVWAWGKTVMVFKPFLGLAENVAGSVVGMTGNSLQSLDGNVVDHLHSIDDKFLNPAITNLVGALLGAAGKTEEIVGPIIEALLKNLGLLKNTAETPEVTSKVQ